MKLSVIWGVNQWLENVIMFVSPTSWNSLKNTDFTPPSLFGITLFRQEEKEKTFLYSSYTKMSPLPLLLTLV